VLTFTTDELQEYSRQVRSKIVDFERHAGELVELGRAIIERGIHIYDLPISVDDVLEPLEAPPVGVDGFRTPRLAGLNLAVCIHSIAQPELTRIREHHATSTGLETSLLKSSVPSVGDSTQQISQTWNHPVGSYQMLPIGAVGSNLAIGPALDFTGSASLFVNPTYAPVPPAAGGAQGQSMSE
jgi:hypothetical protein